MSLIYIKNSASKIPFSKSYKENMELIFEKQAENNYIEL